MAAHIRFRNVTVSYGSRTALSNVSLDLPRHQIFGIIGPANSGKSAPPQLPAETITASKSRFSPSMTSVVFSIGPPMRDLW